MASNGHNGTTDIERHEAPEEIQRKRSDAYAQMDRFDDLNPAQAMAALAGYTAGSLVYQFGGFTGLSATGVMTLAATAGGFDVDADVCVKTERESVKCPTCGGGGTTRDEGGEAKCVNCEGAGAVEKPMSYWHAKATATRAVVTPDGRDLVNRFTASISEPKKADETQSRNQQKAVETKAMRNAIRRHFPAMAKTVEAFIEEAIKQNAVYVADIDAPPAAQEAARASEVRRAFAASSDKLAVGVVSATAFFEAMGVLKDRLTEKQWKALGQDWQEVQAKLCGGKLQDAPQAALAKCYGWLDLKKQELGLVTETVAVVKDEPPPAYSAEGKPLEEYTPTAKELTALLASLDPDRKNDILAKVGADPEKPMSPEQRKTAWAEAHESVNEDGRIQGEVTSGNGQGTLL